MKRGNKIIIGLNVLIKLKKEFIENQNLLKGIIPLHKRTEYSNNRLLELIGPIPTEKKIRFFRLLC